jgi:hypothetical protein
MSEHDRTTERPASPTTDALILFRDGEPYGMEIDGKAYRIRPAKRGDAVRAGDRYAVLRVSRPEA